jgi:undecaprenyl-diphosphatase
MDLSQAAVLGIVQGVAEFLPVSSSGHLVIMQELFGLGEVPLLFDALLHLATLVAVCLVLRKRIAAMLGAFWRFCVRKPRGGDADELKPLIPLIIATALTVAIALPLEKAVEGMPAKLSAGLLLVTALILIAIALLEKKMPPGRALSSVKLRDGLIAGAAQGIGALPGISRSGISISAGLASGLNRSAAAEFSFLMSIPAILGSVIWGLKDADTLMASVEPVPLALAFACALVAGIVSLSLLIRMLKKTTLAWFALYLVPVGAIGLILL